jgi:AcrR family transcriptional regulator
VSLATEPDGRQVRRDRNKVAVLEALIDLFSQGDLDPSPEHIARRAGISPRSVYRYFEDRESLVRAAIDHHLSGVIHLYHYPAIGQGPLAVRLTEFAAHRVRLFETIAPTARASRMRAPTDEIVREQLDTTRRALREQIEKHFARELDVLAPRVRRARVAALDVVCGLEAFDTYRLQRGFSSTETEAILADAIGALLT